MPESLCAMVQDDHVVVTIDPSEWDPPTSIYQEWSGGEGCQTEHEGPGKIQLRAPKAGLKRIISDTRMFRSLSELTPAFELTKEAETDMARRGIDGPDEPRREDRFVRGSRWPKAIMESFSVDGSTWRVSIAGSAHERRAWRLSMSQYLDSWT